jgi:hypothetical protein
MPRTVDFFALLVIIVDRALLARRLGLNGLAAVLAHAAEGVLMAALPMHAHAIASVASRKGDGRSIGSALAQCLSPATAAAVNVIWLLRGARRPAIDGLSEAFGDHPDFVATAKMLCRRVFESAPATLPMSSSPTSATRCEAFAPPGR